MARRIDIELSARRPDGTWTWHSPGARQPRGVVGDHLLPPDAAPGLVLRVDAEFGIDGIEVVGIVATRTPPAKRMDAPNRIEVFGPPRREAPPAWETGLSSPSQAGSPRAKTARGAAPRRDPAERSYSRPGRAERSGSDRESHISRRDGPGGSRDGTGSRRDGPGGSRIGTGSRRDGPGGSRDGTGSRRERPKRPEPLAPSTAYRNAALAELRPEQLPVAEQILRGGIPAVRAAIEEQNTRARSEGRPEVAPEPLLAMAEELLAPMNLASWKDRAVAARDGGERLALRELRSVVAGSSAVSLDEEGRQIADALRARLNERVEALRNAWTERIQGALDAGDVRGALRASAKPPEPAARLPAALAVALAGAAGSAMAADSAPGDWMAILADVLDSPVRRSVKPAGIPTDAGEELIAEARRAAGQVPELARLLGLPIPPPPGPRRVAPRAGVARRVRSDHTV